MSSTTTLTQKNVESGLNLESSVEEKTHGTNHKILTPIQAMSHGPIAHPGLPSFSEPLAERSWVLEHLAGTFRIFARHQYTEGLAGHISVRDPVLTHAFWINPLGVHFAMIKVSDLILLDMNTGEQVGGNRSRPANKTGFEIHAAVHTARPDVHAVAHAHSPFARAWSAFARPLEMINQDVCNVFAVQAVYGEYGGLALDGGEGQKIAECLGLQNKVVILRNHGLLTTGSTVDEAGYLFRLMERSCEVQLAVESAERSGLKRLLIGDAEAQENFNMTSEAENLYCEFQPEYELEVALSGGDFKN